MRRSRDRPKWAALGSRPLLRAAVRSHGGADTEENLVALCSCHHLRGIHGGYIRVRGRAPDRLVWEVGGSVWTGGRIGRRDRDQ